MHAAGESVVRARSLSTLGFSAALLALGLYSRGSYPALLGAGEGGVPFLGVIPIDTGEGVAPRERLVWAAQRTAVVELAPHSVVEEHQHPHEQVGMLLEGRAVFTIGGEEKTLQPGDIYRIPGNVRHKVVTLDQPTRAIDIFSPIREDYL